MSNTGIRCVTALSALLLMAGVALADNWPHWRGPNWDGSAEAADLPSDFSKTQHVKWAAGMPGPSAATPIIWEDRVFVSSAEPGNDSLHALCLDRDTGEVIWRHRVAEGYRRDDRSNFASPSPVTDGQRVIFFYGQGDLIAYDMDGEQLWRRNIQADYGEFNFLWTFSASPTLYDGKLYIQVLQRDVPVRGRGDDHAESFLLAIDPADGKTIYRHVRPSKAVAESREAFTTPVPHEHAGRAQILIAGGDAISGHDPQTGREIWRWGTWNPSRIGHWRLVPSPAAGGGVALACAPKGDPIYAVKLGLEGVLDDSALAWVSDQRTVSSDVPTPLYYRDHFYVLSDVRRNLSKVDPAGGEVLWTVEVPTRQLLRSSPTGADGKVWYMNHGGDVFIHDAGSGELINRIEMGERGDDNIRSSIAVAEGQLFIRTNDKLYCISR